MLSSIVRSAGKRFSSTRAKTQTPHFQLPPEKLRALTCIYHQADSFITPENLSDRIDQAFAGQRIYTNTLQMDFVSSKELELIRSAQRERMKVREWERDVVLPVARANFSEAITMREESVIQALYGVESSSDRTRWLPGVEVLEERDEEDDSGI